MSIFQHRDRILELYDEGHSMQSIAKQTGASRDMVKDVLRWGARPIPSSGNRTLERNKELRRERV